MRREDPLAEAARHSGFFPCVPEGLFKGQPRPPEADLKASLARLPATLRRKTRRDDHDIFRVYNAATPSDVRSAVGMTFDAWMASREPLHGRALEFVLERGGVVKVWLRATRRSRLGHLEAMVHPEDRELLAPVVDFGLGLLGRARTVYCLVPEYQLSLQALLTQRGFDVTSAYTSLVKSMAVRARDRARARVTMPST